MKSDHNDYLQRRDESVKNLNIVVENVFSFKEIRAQSWGLSIRNRFFLIAVLNLLLDDVLESKKYFFKAGKFTTELFKIFNENKYPNLAKSEMLPFTALFATGFLDAILSDNEDVLSDLAVIVQDFGNVAPPFNYHMAYALKYLIIGDMEKAAEHANGAHQNKFLKLPYKGFSHVVKGILDKDISLINEGIQYRILSSKSENKNTVFYHYSIEATALAKLATRYGFQPDISSHFISKSLIQKDQNILYEGVDEILHALTEANRRNGSFLGKISSWIKR